MSGHPGNNELKAFVAGRTDPELLERIAVHLEACPTCVERLETLPDEDPLTRDLRACVAAEDSGVRDLRGRRMGPYELLEQLGHGAMGVVYRAFDLRLKRDVALKLILAGEYADPERRHRLRQEAETIASLRHPGIVQVYDVGEADGIVYLALELLHPGGLAVLTAHQRRPARWYAELVRQMAEPLHYAHQAGIVHRDLKPQNLLIAPSNDPQRYWPDLHHSAGSRPPQVKIADFGLCLALDEDSRLTKDGMMLGTPDYMAPEQVPDTTLPVGVTTDIFSLGAILYELLTGTPPFHANTLARHLQRLREDEPLAPRRSDPRIPLELEAICLKCLEKNPARRYQSALALADDLQRFLDGEPVLARPPSLARKVMLWARRRPVFAFHISAALLLYALHLVAMWVLQEPRHLGDAHDKFSVVILGWIAIAYLLERVRRHPGRRHFGEYLFALFPVALLHAEHWVGTGPDEVIVILFVLMIPAAALIRPTAGMILTVTAATLASFVVFVSWKAHIGTFTYSPEFILFFSLVLFLLGLQTLLLVKRLR